MRCDHSTAQPPCVETQTDRLRLTWPDGHSGCFLYYWLRENCRCPRCTHPTAWERTVDFMALPLDIEPASVRADATGLHLGWPAHAAPCDGTDYTWQWLDRHRSERSARLARKWKPQPWFGADVTKECLAVPHAEAMECDRALRRLLECVEAKGIGLVTGVPTHRLEVVDISERIAFVEESHFGRHFDVMTQVAAQNLAYTADALKPHNDLASRQHLPGVQLLHCRRNDVAGGDSVVVDGLHAATQLRAADPRAFELLSTRSVTFKSVSARWEIGNRAPIIAVDEDGDIVGTRLHTALLGPVDIDPDEQPEFYRSHRALLEIALDPAMQFHFRLDAGDCAIFDNARLMHARTAFDATTGIRHLQGCYVCRDDLQSRLNVLRRGGAEYRLH